MNAQADHFNIRWNNYTAVLQSVFRKLLDGEQFVDVTLACEGKSIKCHRVVLSACSVYFEKLLTDNSYPHLVIYIKDMKYWELQALITFMYNGEVSVNQNKLASLVKAAESLKIKGLAPDSSFQEDSSEKIDEDDIEEYHVGAVPGKVATDRREEKQSLLRQQPSSQPKQLKRKVMTGPPKLVKMQKIERQTNGGSFSLKQEPQQLPSDDEESFPHETAESSDLVIKEDDQDDELEESLEVSLNPVDEGSGDGQSSPSDVEEPHAAVPGRSRFAYKYGKDIRDSALAALSSGMSLRQCSEAFGIPRKTLSKWKNSAPVAAPDENGEHDDDINAITARRPTLAVAPAPVQEASGDRAERLQKAMELAVSGVTVRQAAAHFDIPRTTLCAYMKRRGVAPKRNFLPSSVPARKIGGNGSGSSNGAAKNAQSHNMSQFEDFPFLGISEMMDEMGQGSYSMEEQKILGKPHKDSAALYSIKSSSSINGSFESSCGTGDGSVPSRFSDSSSNAVIALPPGVHPKKIRVIRKHSVEILAQAAMCILKGMTFQHVSELYDVPKTTLRDYMVRKNLLLRGTPKPPHNNGSRTPDSYCSEPTNNGSIDPD